MVEYVLDNINFNVCLVKILFDVVNVMLDIIFYGVIDMVGNILCFFGIGVIYFCESMFCFVRN